MSVIKLVDTNIDVDRILLELEQISEYEQLPEYDYQIGIQGVHANSDPFESCGMRSNQKHPEKDIKVPLFNMPYTNSLMEKYGLVRTRIMKMEERSCYTWHRDSSIRLHIPLITNDFCFFVVEDKVVRMEAGKAYVLDTRRFHTAANASFETRVHLVGAIHADQV